MRPLRPPNTEHDYQKPNTKPTILRLKNGKKQKEEIADEEIIPIERSKDKEVEDFYRSINQLCQEKRSQNTSRLSPNFFAVELLSADRLTSI